MPVNRRIQDITDKRRLAATADSRNDSQDTKRELYIDILKVMLKSAFNANVICPVTFFPGDTLTGSCQILESKRLFNGSCRHLRPDLALENDLPAIDTGQRAHVD